MSLPNSWRTMPSTLPALATCDQVGRLAQTPTKRQGRLWVVSTKCARNPHGNEVPKARKSRPVPAEGGFYTENSDGTR